MLRAHVMPPRNLGNRNPGIQRLGDDPPLLLRRPAPAASYPGANLHPPTRELRVVYSVGHICKTFPLNQREACNIPRAGIKVGSDNRLRCTDVSAHGLRKAAARRLAEIGCSTHEIAAIREKNIGDISAKPTFD